MDWTRKIREAYAGFTRSLIEAVRRGSTGETSLTTALGMPQIHLLPSTGEESLEKRILLPERKERAWEEERIIVSQITYAYPEVEGVQPKLTILTRRNEHVLSVSTLFSLRREASLLGITREWIGRGKGYMLEPLVTYQTRRGDLIVIEDDVREMLSRDEREAYEQLVSLTTRLEFKIGREDE